MRNLGLGALLALGLVVGLSAQAPITEEAFRALRAQDRTLVVLDARTFDEYASGHIPGARLLPYDTVNAATAARWIATKTTPVVVYCRSGRRSALAAEALKALGYTAVRDLGGLGNWSGPWEKGR